VAVLDAIVAPGCSFDEQVLHVCQFRDLSFGCGLTAQLVSDDLARHRVRVQHTFEEALGGSLIAPLLHQYGHCQLEEKLQNFSIKSGKTAGNLIDSEVARRSLTARICHKSGIWLGRLRLNCNAPFRIPAIPAALSAAT
jgi:hypothetical protein